MDKIAEEIIKPFLFEWHFVTDIVYKDNAIEAMQSYHEAKLKEITDSDIEAWAKKKGMPEDYHILIIGAKALLNGEIKHIK